MYLLVFFLLVVAPAAAGSARADRATLKIETKTQHLTAQESARVELLLTLADKAGNGIPGAKIRIKSGRGAAGTVESLGAGKYRAVLEVPAYPPPRPPGYLAVLAVAELKDEAPAAGLALPVYSNLVVRGNTAPGTVLYAAAGDTVLGGEVTADGKGEYKIVAPAPPGTEEVAIIPRDRPDRAKKIRVGAGAAGQVVAMAVPEEIGTGKRGRGSIVVYAVDGKGGPETEPRFAVTCEPGECGKPAAGGKGVFSYEYKPPAAVTDGKGSAVVKYEGKTDSAVFVLKPPAPAAAELAADAARAAAGDEIRLSITVKDTGGDPVDAAEVDVFAGGAFEGKAVREETGLYSYIYRFETAPPGGAVELHAEITGGAAAGGARISSDPVRLEIEEPETATAAEEETAAGGKTGGGEPVSGGTGESRPGAGVEPPGPGTPAAVPAALTLALAPETVLPGDAVSITARLTDGKGSGMPGAAVSFAAESGALSETLDAGGGTYKARLETNESAAAGAMKIEAACECGGANLRAEAVLTITPLPPAALVLSADRQEIFVGSGDEINFEASVKNRLGAGIEGKTVSLQLKDVSNVMNISLQTGGDGAVVFTYQPSDAPGLLSVTATVKESPSLSEILEIGKLRRDISRMELTPGSDAVPADGATALEIEVHAVNVAGADAAGERIDFRIAAGGGRLNKEYITTGEDGREYIYYTPDTSCGTAEIRAYSYRDSAIKANVAIEKTPAVAADLELLETPPVLVAGGDAWTLRVKVTDAGGCPLAGETVTFETDGGTVTTEAETDSGGIAAAVYTTGPVPGSVTVTGRPETDRAIVLSSEINVTQVAYFTVTPADYSITAGQPLRVAVTAKNSQGETVQRYNPAGKLFSFSGPAAAPDSTAPVYPDTGAIAQAFSAGSASFDATLFKSETVSITFSDGAAQGISAPITVAPAATAVLTAAGGDNQTAYVSTPVSSAPMARVTDAYDNPVPGIQVTFNVTAGGGTVAGSQAETGADGTASPGAWTLGPSAGTNLLSASLAPSGPAPAIFTATAVASDPTASISNESGASTIFAGQSVNFSAAGSSPGPGAQIISYSWDFDGDSLEDSNATDPAPFTYIAPASYTVTLTVTNSHGRSDTGETLITVEAIPGPPPSPTAAISNESGATSIYAGQSLDFSGTASSPGPGAQITSYSWDFDGDSLEDSNSADPPPFFFNSPGIYTVSLTVTNNFGESSSALATIQVLPVPSPTAAISNQSGISTIYETESMDFSGTASSPGAGASISSYSWDFNGDSLQDSADADPGSYTYNTTGSYLVSLTVTNSLGQSNTATTTVRVLPAGSPSAEITIQSGSRYACPGNAVDFSGAASHSPGATSIVSYAWDFDGDSATDSTAADPAAFVYTTPGVYTVTLTVQNNLHAVDSASETLYVAAGSAFTLTPNPASINANGADTAVITSNVTIGCGGIPIPDGTRFTVAASLGTITGEDSDPGTPGFQTSSLGGAISFSLKAGTTPGAANILAESADGAFSAFTTVELAGADGVRPFVVSFSPSGNFTGTVADITVKFSENVVAAKATNPAGFRVQRQRQRGESFQNVLGTRSYDADTFTAVFTFNDAPYDVTDKHIRVTITKNVTDIAGNGLDGGYNGADGDFVFDFGGGWTDCEAPAAASCGAAPASFSPDSSDSLPDTSAISFSLTDDYYLKFWRIQVTSGADVVKTYVGTNSACCASECATAGAACAACCAATPCCRAVNGSFSWDGRNENGELVENGDYSCSATAYDLAYCYNDPPCRGTVTVANPIDFGGFGP